MAKLRITTDNPGKALEVEIADATLLGLFTDVAGIKVELRLHRWLGGIFLAGGFSIIAALIVVL